MFIESNELTSDLSEPLLGQLLAAGLRCQFPKKFAVVSVQSVCFHLDGLISSGRSKRHTRVTLRTVSTGEHPMEFYEFLSWSLDWKGFSRKFLLETSEELVSIGSYGTIQLIEFGPELYIRENFARELY